MHVLVTGGSGFVGSQLVNDLLRYYKHEVTVLDNGYSDNFLSLLPNIDLPLNIIKGDITNKEDVKKAMDKADIVIHLAALVGGPVCQKEQRLSHLVNVEGTHNIVEAAQGRKVIFSSTESVYGDVDVYSEDVIPNPSSLYAKQKYQAEQIVLSNPNSLVYRFGAAFGLGKKPRTNLLINTLVHEAITTGSLVVYQPDVIRNFISLYNMCWVLAQGINQLSGIYNCCDLTTTKREIAEKIKTKLGTHIFYGDVKQDIDKRDGRLKIDKLCSHFSLKVDLDKELDLLIKGFQLVS